MNNILAEHRFWLQIMGDHARFIITALSTKERRELERAAYFIQCFDQLLNVLSDSDAFHRKVQQEVAQLRQFKLQLLQRQLSGQISLNLSPTFLNHMLNELEEYQRVVYSVLNTPHSHHAVHQHLLWLSDASLHAIGIYAFLDGREFKAREEAEIFRQQFDGLYLTAVEHRGYLRTGLSSYSALEEFNRSVELQMLAFMLFLKELEESRRNNTILGVLSHLMADHMAREECYYLHKLAAASGTKPPACDPAKPRIDM